MTSPTVAALTGGAALLVLDEAAAARTWNAILARQGLADSCRLTSACQVADAALGLHAARLPSPYAIVAARTSDPAIPASLFTTPVRSSLLTLRCMRKTLHTLPLHLAAAAHCATVRFRDRDARRAVANAGHTMAAIDRLTDQLCVLLRDGPLPHRVIEARLANRGNDIRAGRLAVKVAWERGLIAYINTASSWNREARTFALTRTAYPALDLSLPRGRAVTELVSAYFDRYGPATIRDVTWWSGLSATDITTALLATGRPVTAVATPWSEDPCLMFADQAEQNPGGDAVTDGSAVPRPRGHRPQGLSPDPQPLPRRPATPARVQPDRGGPAHCHHRRDRGRHLVLEHPHRDHQHRPDPGQHHSGDPQAGKGPRRRADRNAPLSMGTPAALPAPTPGPGTALPGHPRQ